MKISLVLAFSIIATLVIAETVARPTAANARWYDYPHAGYCPIGTCNKIGGWRALNVRNCSAANCRR
jgi:hypothetical protein